MTAQTGDILFNGQRFAAFFFDMDGTILTSIRVAERIWGEWAVRHGIDPVAFLPTIHGVRAVETIARQNLPGVDAEAEAQRITEAEIADVDGVEAIGGAREFLQALPMDRWAIVTSAPKALALRRIQAAGLPEPKVIIAAEDVSRGKPAPEGYLLAAEKLGVNVADCLVFEDALAGVQAGEAAGAKIFVISGTNAHHAGELSRYTGAENYDALRVEADGSGIFLQLS
ncbi:HAD-IA family hydrolase [Enterobacter sp. Ap-1006]|uniref:HAD-IA family hydrolase n=1 Tax=Enterobacter sp. Ap-1006 TaxID=2608345 RepID=UPI0019660627|nr:HAD-IA family hydrolase [Enterobacter sp. Ap-1006]